MEMNGKQIKTAFDELEANNPLERAKVFVKVIDRNGATASITVDRGEYDLLVEDGLLITRYDYEDDAMTAKLFGRTQQRHVGANFIPFESILVVELIAEEERE